MKKVTLLLLLCSFTWPLSAQDFSSRPKKGFLENKGQFKENGQVREDILFQASTNGLRVYITTKGLSYLHEEENEWTAVHTLLEDADIRAENIVKENPAPGELNYLDKEVEKSIYGVRAYQKITIKNVYPKIDWVIYDREKGIEHDFLVHPGGNPDDIKLRYEGADLALNEDKNMLSIKTPFGELKEGKLFCYQNTNNGQQSTINANFELSDNKIIFKLAHYQIDKLLTIDPAIEWATYFGGDDNERSNAVDTDANGFVFITGSSYEGDPVGFPTLDPGGGAYYNPTHNTGAAGQWTGFISKFDNNGVLIWSTYFANDYQSSEGFGIVVAPNQDVYIAGTANSSSSGAALPVMSSGPGCYFQPVCANPFGNGNGRDGFIARFSNNGNLKWCTYFGGGATGIDPLEDQIKSIDADHLGNIFVTGYTGNDDIPMMDPGGGAYYHTLEEGTFISKFDANNGLAWSTYVEGGVRGYGVCTDHLGNVYLAGSANDSYVTFDPGGGAYFQPVHGGGNLDVGLTKFDNNGVILWSTLYGGGTAERGQAIDCDPAGNLFLTGYVGGTVSDLPLQDPGGGAFMQTTHNMGGGSNDDDFIAKFSAANNSLIWASYLGGTRTEADGSYDIVRGHDLDCDPFGNVIVVGNTESFDFPTLDPGGNHYFESFKIGMDLEVYVTMFNNNGVMTWSTFYGGGEPEYGKGVAADNKGCFFVTGSIYSESSDDVFTLDPGNGAYFYGELDQNKGTGRGDGFILKFCSDDLRAVLTAEDLKCKGDNSGSVTADPSGGLPGYTYDWQPGGGTDSTMTGLSPGTYTVTIRDQNDSIFIDSITITEPDELELTTISSVTICPGDSATLTASASGGTPDYNFDWNSGANTSDTYVVKPSTTTKYPVKVTDDNGCEAFDTVEVIIGPPIAVTAHNDTTICPGDSIPIWASGGSSYSWSPTTGLSDPNVFNPTAAPSATTTYTVTVSSGSCPPIQDSVTITIGAGVTATISNDITICEGEDTVLTAAGGTNYSWSPTSDLSNASSATPTASPSSTTRYTVTVSDASGCDDTASVLITVNPAPTVTISGDTAICLGDSSVLTASGGSSYTWSTGDNTPSTTVTPVAASTTYTVTVDDGSGCTTTETVTVTTASTIIANAGIDDTICPGDTAFLQVSGGTTYSWNPSTGLSDPNISNPTATPTATTTYTVSVSSGSCTPVDDEITIVVNTTINAAAGPDSTICSGDSVQLTASGGTTYSWSPPTGLSDPNIANPIATPPLTTTYTVTVSSGNCAPATATVDITVEVLFINANSGFTICFGEDAQLDVTQIAGASYSWTPATLLDDAGSYYPIADSLTTTTTFSVTVSKGNCPPVTDETTITVRPPIVPFVGPEQFMCPGDSVQLFASGGDFYSWWPPEGISNTSIANPMASPDSTTTYEVDVSTIHCGPVRAYVTVNIVDTIIADAGTDTTICEGDTAFLFASGGSSYAWSHGTSTAWDTISPNVTTTYTVTVSSGSCAPDDDEVTVFVTNANIGNSGDVTITEGTSTTLSANGGTTYSWSPSTGLSDTSGASITASPTVTTTYTITGIDADGCVDTISITVTVVEGCGNVFLPTAFSPNKDGANDILYVRGDCISTIELVIFDRWGEEVFVSTDPNKGWDGTFEGKDMDSAVFDYTLKATNTDGTAVERSGNVSLIR